MESLLALTSSALWGTADFLGGKVSKRRPPIAVVGFSQSFGLIVMVIIATLTASWGADTGYIPWAFLGAVSGVLGLLTFYWALAHGVMGIVAPITACGVVVPVTVGIARGDVPTPLQAAGMVFAIAGIVLATGPELRGDGNPRAVVFAAISGVLFGLVFVALAGGGEYSSIMTVTAMRIFAVIGLVSAGLILRSTGGVSRSDLPAIATVGVFDALANVALGAAAQGNNLTITAVLGSFYPIVTALLAWAFLDERMRKIQYVGVSVAMVGVVILSASGGH